MDHNKSSFIFNLEGSHSSDPIIKQIEWARRVFAEPVQVASSPITDWLKQDSIDTEVEAALYTNLQSRDSEIGIHLLERRKNELQESLQTIRQGLTKRERDLAMARTRVDTMRKINASEPNLQLQYSLQTLKELEAKIAAETREFEYLRKRRVLLDGLTQVLRVFDEGEHLARSSEQMIRLFGQSFRAQAKLHAFAYYFRDSLKERLPNLKPYVPDKGFGGYLLPLSSTVPPIIIDQKAAAYLLHFLETINKLTEISAERLRNQEKLSNESWFPLLTLLRAIVEFFYICNFELPFFYSDLFVDAENVNMLWNYHQDQQLWQSIPESLDTGRYIKRVSAEAALLIMEDEELLVCRTPDILNRFLKREAQGETDLGVPADLKFHSYIGFGLAEYDIDSLNQRGKLRTTFAPVGAILESIVEGQEGCKRIASSKLGGPLETILGLSELDPRAFGLEGEAYATTNPLDKLDRYRLLSRFWRATSRRRAITMLGEEYTKKIASGLEMLGEPGPEHPTFISIALKPTIARISLTQGEQFADPFGTLIIADQVRIVEMLNITWAIASEFLGRLKDVHSQGKLKRIIEGLPQIVSVQETELRKRYNPKLVQSEYWVLTLLRSIAPTLCDFWMKVGDGTPWVEPFLKVPPLQGLSLLLRLFCETARIILLVEVSGSELGERLEIGAESAGELITEGVDGYLEGGPMPAAIAESMSSYFDPEVRFDSWLAFINNFQDHLEQTEVDMLAMNAGELHIESLKGIMRRLSLLYPGAASAATPSSSNQKTVNQPVVSIGRDLRETITEADAELFSHIYFELLEMSEGEAIVLLKLISMLSRKETKKFLQVSNRISSLITNLLPEQNKRLLLFTLPTTTATFFKFLESLEKVEAGSAAIELSKARIADYFENLEGYIRTLNEQTGQVPNLLPGDRDLIKGFLNATSPAHRDLSFLLLFVCDQLVMDICTNRADCIYQVDSAVGKIEAFMRETFKEEFKDKSLEIFPISGGKIICSDNRFFITGHNESFEPTFAEPERAMSNYLLSKVASIKFSFAAQILRQEFPQIQFFTQV
jgi:hypothetical protein